VVKLHDLLGDVRLQSIVIVRKRWKNVLRHYLLMMMMVKKKDLI
jgi:hypothetical protein